MTAIVVLENIADLGTPINLNREMYAYLKEESASVAGFLPNETVSAEDLLYGLLLPSGAECAIGLAEYIAGSEKDFVKLMNEKAWLIGMTHTRFANTTGLHNIAHFSTLEDIAVLLTYALKNDTFYEIFTTAQHTSQPTNLHPEGLTVTSTLFFRTESLAFEGGQILGGKTGFTDEAGQCLASLAEINDELFVLITCGAQRENARQQLHIDDALAVYSAIAASRQ